MHTLTPNPKPAIRHSPSAIRHSPSAIRHSPFVIHLALQQRVLPAYRAPFFDMLADACDGGLSVFAGQPLPVEGIATADHLELARLTPARNLHFRDPSSSAYLCWQRGLTRWLDEWQPDALIVEANPRYLSTRLAVRWMHARGKPILGWGLGAPPLGGFLAPLRRWNRLSFLRSLDGVIAYSRRGAEEYRTLGLPPERVFVACNAVAPRPTTPPPERSLPLGGPPTVLFVGRLQARKRIDILLHACAALSESLQPQLIVVGDGSVISNLQSLAQQIYPSTEFTGAKHGPELKQYFAAADLFALPGTGGLAVQQAMTHGLPVIVAKGDGTQDDLVRPQNGWQVPPGNQEAFTQTLRAALADIPRLRRMGAESFRIVTEEINLEAMVGVFVEAIGAVSVRCGAASVERRV
ncbi:MAG: glycosyltransferase [Chloroflexi bacterium]|nr:glycosyltransferase [Chloroflexota bacterium]